MSGITILDRANIPMGPFTRAEVAAKLQRGEVTLSSLAFVDGLAQWTPLRDVLARVDAANAPPPVPASAAPPAVPAPAVPTPAYSYAATMEPPPHLVYAGFWLRFVAHLIDVVMLIVGAVALLCVWGILYGLLIGFKNIGFHPEEDSALSGGTFLLMAILNIGLVVAMFAMGWLYHACLESSVWQGTLGKRVLNLRVTSMTGERISFWHASGRFFGRILATLPFFIGYLTMLFTERKQALHDLIASTLVVRA
jgi:uncharacterized RDD family membrane protein YckC